jgi:Protein of unknown function (DUF2934)
MRSVSIRSTKPDRKTPPQQSARKFQALSRDDDMHMQIEKRAYELYSERGYRGGSALDDWLDAEREVLAQMPHASHMQDEA